MSGFAEVHRTLTYEPQDPRFCGLCVIELAAPRIQGRHEHQQESLWCST